MNKEIITFENIEIGRRNFHYSKYPINISDVDITEIVTANKVSFCKKCFKYFIGYKVDQKVKCFCCV